MMTELSGELFRTPGSLIGREHERKAVDAALVANLAKQRALYFVGDGGIGKTSLLVDSNRRAEQLPKTLASGVIDLYQTRYQQPELILRTLVRRLRRSLAESGERRRAFVGYDHALEESVAAQQLGENDRSLGHEAIERAFLEDYAALSKDYRIILLIDTFEKLHPEIERTEVFNFRQTNRLEQWLVGLIARLPNTLTLIAGRPRPKQRRLLQQALGSGLSVVEVKPFDLAETEAYVRASLPPNYDLMPELFETLHNVSAGRPVILAIALAFEQVGLLDLTSLPPGFENRYPDNRAKLSEAFVAEIVSRLQNDRPDIADLLTKAVYLRKGMYIELLRRIGQAEHGSADYDHIEAQLLEFRKLPFVKVSDRTVTLHDEMYDLLLGKLGAAQSTEWYRAAVDYLTERIANVAQVGEYEDEKPYLYRTKQTLQAERLFYQMALDPVLGYQEYREICRDTIRGRDADFDTQLQGVLAGFYDENTAWGHFYRRQLQLGGLSWDQVIYNEGVHWVNRRTATDIKGRNRYEEALHLADRVAKEFPGIYTPNTLEWADLELSKLEAQAFLRGRTGLATQYVVVTSALERILETLEKTQEKHSIDIANVLHSKSILAYGYNQWGYRDRTRQRFNSAVDKYKRAIMLFKDLGEDNDTQRAIALNNLAFAVAQQGNPDRGLVFAQQALQIAEAQGALHRVAAILNTLARIQLERNEGAEALRHVQRAREILEELSSIRYLGLNAHAEGDIRRWLAYSNREHATRSFREYELSFERYNEAIRLLDQEGEPLRRIEARQGLGCAYRSRGFSRFQREENPDDDMLMAEKYLQEALVLCPQHGAWPILARVLEDIAVIYVNLKHYDTAAEWLKKARAAIPAEYEIVEGVGLTDTEATRQQQVFWLLLGQVELQHGLCESGRANYIEVCTRFLRAFACIQTFSWRAPQLDVLRFLGRRELARIPNSATLEDLRVETYWIAQRFHIDRAAVAEMERLFDEAIEDIRLL